MLHWNLMRKNMIRDTSGFTLTEVLIAITILAVISGIIYNVITTVSITAYRFSDRSGYHRAVRLLSERVSSDIESAYFSPIDKWTAFEGRSDSIQFTLKTADEDRYPLGIREAGFRFDQSTGALMMRTDDLSDSDPLAGGVERVILRGVSRFSIEYFDNETGLWSGSWSAKDTGKLPRLIRIRAALNDGNGGGGDIAVPEIVVSPQSGIVFGPKRQ